MMPGRTHERLVQRHEGLPVFGGEVVRQLDGATNRQRLRTAVRAIAFPTTEPALSPADAAALADRAIAATAPSAGTPELGILPDAEGARLVYRTESAEAWDIRDYFVNATSGAIERRREPTRRQQAEVGSAPASSATRRRSAPPHVQRLPGHRSAAAGRRLHARLPRQRIAFNTFLQTGPCSFRTSPTSSSNVWTDGAVVDAHVYEGWVYDYFFKRFGRRGIDDRNLESSAMVHPLARAKRRQLPAGYRRAVRSTTPPISATASSCSATATARIFDYLAGGFDVVAHEMTHGVTEFTSNLAYQDEPGALNEAFSDIMAMSARVLLPARRAGPPARAELPHRRGRHARRARLHPIGAEPDRGRRSRSLFAAAVHRHRHRQRRRARERHDRHPRLLPGGRPADAIACPASRWPASAWRTSSGWNGSSIGRSRS